MRMTLDDKLKTVCSHFVRLHALYGKPANLPPPTTARVGLLGVPKLHDDPGEGD